MIEIIIIMIIMITMITEQQHKYEKDKETITLTSQELASKVGAPKTDFLCLNSSNIQSPKLLFKV